MEGGEEGQKERGKGKGEAGNSEWEGSGSLIDREAGNSRSTIESGLGCERKLSHSTPTNLSETPLLPPGAVRHCYRRWDFYPSPEGS